MSICINDFLFWHRVGNCLIYFTVIVEFGNVMSSEFSNLFHEPVNHAKTGRVSTYQTSGGDDNDELSGAQGSDLIFGGLGDDNLTGASGNDFLIGGGGSDRIVGSAGHDILVAGDLACSITEQDLWAALADWVYGRGDDDGTGGGSGDDVLDELLPIIDGDFDQLTGSSGADLFIINDGDKITDLKKALRDGDEIRIL